MWDKLKRLRQARDSAHLAPARYSPLYVVIESASRYLDLSGTAEQVLTVIEETQQAFEDLLQQEEANPEHDPRLLNFIESTLDLLDGFAHCNEENVTQLLRELEELDEHLQSFDLAKVYQRLLLQREQRELLEEIACEFSDEELEAGYLLEIIRRCDELVHAGTDPESTLNYLEEAYSKMQLRQANYQQTPLREEEWTLEVALADRFMQQGFDLWLQALRGLLESCVEPPDEASIVDWLETLREGNRNWLLVERLSQAR